MAVSSSGETLASRFFAMSALTFWLEKPSIDITPRALAFSAVSRNVNWEKALAGIPTFQPSAPVISLRISARRMGGACGGAAGGPAGFTAAGAVGGVCALAGTKPQKAQTAREAIIKPVTFLILFVPLFGGESRSNAQLILTIEFFLRQGKNIIALQTRLCRFKNKVPSRSRCWCWSLCLSLSRRCKKGHILTPVGFICRWDSVGIRINFRFPKQLAGILVISVDHTIRLRSDKNQSASSHHWSVAQKRRTTGVFYAFGREARCGPQRKAPLYGSFIEVIGHYFAPWRPHGNKAVACEQNASERTKVTGRAGWRRIRRVFCVIGGRFAGCWIPKIRY